MKFKKNFMIVYALIRLCKMEVRAEINSMIRNSHETSFVINLKVINLHCVYIITGGTIYSRGRELRHSTKSREVAGSNFDGGTEMFL